MTMITLSWGISSVVFMNWPPARDFLA